MKNGLIEYPSGNKVWYKDGRLHRTDGPAFIDFSGYKEWWINGIEYSKEEFNKIMES